jgi:hypothetical protein
MIADQRYVTTAVKKAVTKLSKQSIELMRRYGNYNLVLRGVSTPNVQEINFAFSMHKLESDMIKAQQQTDIGTAKGQMGQVCNEIISVISGQYVLDIEAAKKFKKWIAALQFACYIQKRYKFRNDAEKNSLIQQLSSMTDGEDICQSDSNPQTFSYNLSGFIGSLLTKVKSNLPADFKYMDELIDQIAEVSSFDGGTAEITAHNYSVNVPKLRRMNMGRATKDIIRQTAYDNVI